MRTGVYAEIMRSLGRDEFRVPPLPDITQRIASAMKDPELSVIDLSRIIQSDPGLADHLLKAVNSAGWRVFRKIKTCQDAVSRLGLHATRNQSYVYSMRAMFRQVPKSAQPLMQRHARQSTRVAACAFTLAGQVKKIDADEAMLVAMLQDIGIMPIIEWMARSPEVDLTDEEKSWALLSELANEHGMRISLIVLEQWKFDRRFLPLVHERGNWSRKGGDDLDVCDVVNLARVHAGGGIRATRHLPHITLLPALMKLKQRELTEERTLQVLAEREEEIEELQQMLLP